MALVELTEDTLMLILPWRNTPAVRQSMFNSSVINEDEHREWFIRLQKNDCDKWFLHQVNGVFDGVVYFTGINRQTRSTIWGFYMSPEATPGSGTQLGIEGLDMAFNILKVKKVFAKVLTSNKKSLKFHMKLGFEQLAPNENDNNNQAESHQYDTFMLTFEQWRKLKPNILSKIKPLEKKEAQR